MARQSSATTLASWRRLFDSLDEATSEALQLTEHRERLAEMYKRVLELRTQQAVLAAAKQEATREIAELLEKGRTTASFMRVNLAEHFGNRNPKLIEHGIPLYKGGRPRKKKTASAKS